jgi:ribosomal protein L40E
MVQVCSACGAENAWTALACRRCHRLLGGGAARVDPAAGQAAGAEAGDLSGSLGEVCRKCESYNEPGAKRCAHCGAPLGSQEEPPPRAVAPQAGRPPGWGSRPEPTALKARFLPAKGPTEAPGGKPCPSCGAKNPAGAKFCCECGLAFPRSAPPAPAPEDDPDLPVALDPDPPFRASLVVERGATAGTSFPLRMNNALGAGGGAAAFAEAGTAVQLRDDPWLAPLQATVLFDDQRLLLRDEGGANGVYLRVRGPLSLSPGDHFIAGERLLRFDGPAQLPAAGKAGTPFLGAPRPQGALWRVTEVLQGGGEGRVCLRPGPVISLGKTGCDLSFPADAKLSARHAEIRVAADGSVALHDLGAAPDGVFLRLREKAAQELRQDDVLLVGDQQLRVKVG